MPHSAQAGSLDWGVDESLIASLVGGYRAIRIGNPGSCNRRPIKTEQGQAENRRVVVRVLQNKAIAGI